MRIIRKLHVIVTSYPAQEHVAPLMKLAYKIAENGIKVTFVNADFMHHKIISSMSLKLLDSIPINLVPVSTGLDRLATNCDPIDDVDLMKSILSNVPHNFQRLIENVNRAVNEEPVSFVVADVSAWWAIKVAEKLDIKRAMVAPFGLGNLALQLQAPKLIDSGLLDLNGIPLANNLMIYLSKETLPWHTEELTWSMEKASNVENFIFRNFTLKTSEIAKISDWILVNSFYELESSVYDLIPKALPIGPLIMNGDQLEHQKEDSTYLNWLDQQPKNSVLYASFGSTAVCNQQQFDELAYAFERIGRPFLWAAGSDFTKAANFPEGFIERVANFGKIVKWAREEKVLSHPSVACFILSCGWNSTIEGVSKGVPFICWPYSSDQRRNSRVICEIWKVGVQVVADQDGIVTSQEIKSKISKLVSSQDIKLNSRRLMEIGARSGESDGGSSFNNFMNFIQHVIC